MSFGYLYLELIPDPRKLTRSFSLSSARVVVVSFVKARHDGDFSTSGQRPVSERHADIVELQRGSQPEPGDVV